MIFFTSEKVVFKLPHATLDSYFNREVIIFLLMILTIAAGYFVCFWGYKYLVTLALILLGCAAGAVSITILDEYIKYPVLQMFLFVMFVFFAEFFLYFLYSAYCSFTRNIRHGKVYKYLTGAGTIHNFICNKFKTDSPIKDLLSVTSPFTGAMLSSLVIYQFIYRDIILCIILAAVVSIAGLIYQKKNNRFHRNYYTYDDIYYGR